MNFSEYAICEVNDLCCELSKFMDNYTKENLKAFDKDKKIIIATCAIGQFLTLIYETNLELGIMSIETIKEVEKLRS